jgi:hypothetical protein
VKLVHFVGTVGVYFLFLNIYAVHKQIVGTANLDRKVGHGRCVCVCVCVCVCPCRTYRSPPASGVAPPLPCCLRRTRVCLSIEAHSWQMKVGPCGWLETGGGPGVGLGGCVGTAMGLLGWRLSTACRAAFPLHLPTCCVIANPPAPPPAPPPLPHFSCTTLLSSRNFPGLPIPPPPLSL